MCYIILHILVVEKESELEKIQTQAGQRPGKLDLIGIL
jgi:hypothetical protein